MIMVRTLDRTRKYLFTLFQLKPYIEKEKNKNMRNDLKSYRKECSIGMTEVIAKGNPRENRFDDAKRKKLNALSERGTWDIISKSDVPQNAHILGGRFVLAMKDEGTKNEVWKARFFVQGYRDKLKTTLEHNATTVRQVSIPELIVFSSTLNFCIFSIDVTQAYHKA